MDRLYSKYSCPMDLMNRYINQGRFGEFVNDFLTLEMERRKEEMEKQQHRDLWAMYVHSYTNESFGDFKERVCKPDKGGTRNAGSDAGMTQDDALAIVDSLFD